LIKLPFVNRLSNNSDDPTEVLSSAISQAENVEKTLKQCLEIGKFLIDEHNNLILVNLSLNSCIEGL